MHWWDLEPWTALKPRSKVRPGSTMKKSDQALVTVKRAQFASLRLKRSNLAGIFSLGCKPAASELKPHSLGASSLTILAWLRAKSSKRRSHSLHCKQSHPTKKNFRSSRLDSRQVKIPKKLFLLHVASSQAKWTFLKVHFRFSQSERIREKIPSRLNFSQAKWTFLKVSFRFSHSERIREKIPSRLYSSKAKWTFLKVFFHHTDQAIQVHDFHFSSIGAEEDVHVCAGGWWTNSCRYSGVSHEKVFQDAQRTTRMTRVHVHLHNRCVSVANRVDKRYNEILWECTCTSSVHDSSFSSTWDFVCKTSNDRWVPDF